jgi:hypothetical protein
MDFLDEFLIKTTDLEKKFFFEEEVEIQNKKVNKLKNKIPKKNEILELTIIEPIENSIENIINKKETKNMNNYKEKNKSCHQCKTSRIKCTKIYCSVCARYYCKNCLKKKYNLEINDPENWICLYCKKICNCKTCLKKFKKI